MRGTYAIVASLAVATGIASAQMPVWSYSFQSDAGEWVGQGMSLDFDQSNATVSISRNFDNGIDVSVGSWDFRIAMPFEAEPTPGLYTGATRFPFQDADDPGLSISGPGRGYNMSEGFFEIYAIEFAGDGTVERYDIDFQISGDSGLGTRFFNGQFRYAIPTPASAGVLGLMGVAAVRRRR